MAWGRFGDNVGLYPRLLQAVARDDAPEGAYPMLFGFLGLLTASSTAYSTDYVVTLGNVRQAGAEQWRWCLDASLATGLLTKVRRKVHGGDAYKLIDDPAFLHIRLKAEIEWDAQQKNDTENLRLSVPVRLRDGDLCRYCGTIVHWYGPTQTKNGRKATYDHLEPGQPATVATLVIACLSCNSEQRDARGDARKPLLDPPITPFYSESTAKWLTKNGRPTRATSTDDDSDPALAGHRASSKPTRQRPAPADTAQVDVADSDPASAGHRAATPEPVAGAPPPTPTRSTPVGPRVRRTSHPEKSDSPGTGRDGTGSDSYRSTDPSTMSARRRRSSRARREEPPS